AGARIEVRTDGVEGVALRSLSVALPDGGALLRDVEVKLERGERVLVSGASGSGKSTLFRAIAGIWPFGSGRIERPDTARCLFLPQKPYLPIGSLRGVLSYPAADGAFPDAPLPAPLAPCALPPLSPPLPHR